MTDDFMLVPVQNVRSIPRIEGLEEGMRIYLNFMLLYAILALLRVRTQSLAVEFVAKLVTREKESGGTLKIAGDMEEEEYAWLPAEFLKPFQPGDTSGNPDAPASTDATLQACVEAATKAVLDREKLEAGDGSLEINGYLTDSDGGELDFCSSQILMLSVIYICFERCCTEIFRISLYAQDEFVLTQNELSTAAAQARLDTEPISCTSVDPTHFVLCA